MDQQPQNPKPQPGVCRKTEIFALSFLAYTSVHALRTTYSFSKAYLPEQIHIHQNLIGLVDSVMLLCVGLGNFLIATRIGPGKVSHPIFALWMALVFCALEYCTIPFAMNRLDGYPAFFTLLFLMGLSGFLQSYTWPNLLPLVRTVAHPDRDATLLGFWSTCNNFGNILGFVLCQEFVLINGLGWWVGMYIVAAYMLSIGLAIAVRVDEIQLTNEKDDLVQGQEIPKLSVFEVIRSPLVTLLAISFTLMKSVLYGILLWLPVYFHSIGLVEYQLYIPMVFDGSAVFGSIIIGAIFKVVSPHRRNITLIPIISLLVILFFVLKTFDLGVGGYFTVIGMVGVCLGGSYNTMASLVTMELARAVPERFKASSLQFFSALLMAMGNTVTAITQVVISFGVGQNDEEKLFGIFLTYTCINLGCLIAAVIIEQKIKEKNLPLLEPLKIEITNLQAQNTDTEKY